MKVIANDENLNDHLTLMIREFGDLLGNPSVAQLMGEILNKQESHRTDNTLKVFQSCDANYFHHLLKFLKILCTFTISATLRLLKSFSLREKPPSVDLFIHRNIEIDLEKVINRFAKKRERSI